MFVLVVDTSLMNVSIAAVVRDLDTTVSSVQSAIALEALVSAAFILISSKVGDLFGRKRAYVLGLLGYAIGAVAMTLAQSLTAIIIFWAIIGGLGASLLLPAMQSLIHGNFEGAAQKKTYALVGAAAAIAAAVGPLLGGFVTTYLSWRVGFLLEAVVIAVVLSQIGLLKDVPYTGERQVDGVGAGLSVIGMGGVVLGILVWQEGGDYVALLIAIGALALWALARWLVRRHREGKVTLLDPELFPLPHFRLGFTAQMLQNVTLGGAMIALPIFLQIKLEYDALETGLSLAPLSLTMFAVAILAGRRSGGRRASVIIRTGFALSTLGLALIIPIVPDADSGWYLLIPLVIAGAGLGLLVSQLNNYTLAPIDDDRISEAAGVNSASGSFGLSFGLAVAGGILLATLSLAFTNMTNASPVIPSSQQQQIAQTLEDDAQVVSNTQLDETARRRAPGRPGRGPRDQHRRDEPRPAGGAARADPRGPPRLLQRVPHDAPAGHRAFGLRRSSGIGLTPGEQDPADARANYRTMSTTAGQELRPVTSLWWLPLLFGVVALGVGVFFVVSPHETLSTFTAIAGIFVLRRRRHRDRRLDLRLGRGPRAAGSPRRAQRHRRAHPHQEAVRDARRLHAHRRRVVRRRGHRANRERVRLARGPGREHPHRAARPGGGRRDPGVARSRPGDGGRDHRHRADHARRPVHPRRLAASYARPRAGTGPGRARRGVSRRRQRR